MQVPLEEQIQAVREATKELEGRWRFGLDAAAATLVWLRDNQAELRCIAGTLGQVKRDPGVARVLATWPGAKIVAVREREEA